MEELGSGSFDEPFASRSEPAPKRRSLAVTDDSGPSDFFEFAPLPGGGSGMDAGSYLDVGPLDLEEAVSDDETDQDDDLALDLARDPVIAQSPVDTDKPFEAVAAAPSPVDFGAVASDDDFRPSSPQFSPRADDRTNGMEPVDMTQEYFNQNAYNPLAGREPVESAPMRPFAMPDAYSPSEHSAAAEPSEAAVSAPALAAAAMPDASVPERPLAELGVAELVERFASALQKHAAPSGHVEAPFPVVGAEHETRAVFSPVAQVASGAPMVFRRAQAAQNASPAATEAPSAFAAPSVASTQYTASPVPAKLFGKAGLDEAPSVPAALRPFDIDENDDHDEADDFAGLSLSLDQRLPETGVASSPEESADLLDDDGTSNGNYSSLLAMKNALSTPREFVRIDDDEQYSDQVEPVVVFPGQNQAAPAPAAHDFGLAASAAASPRQGQAARRFDSPAATPAARPTDAGETERALREALEKLQRMSGAA